MKPLMEENMKHKLKYVIWPVMAIGLFFLAKVMESQPKIVEHYYSTSVNKWMIQILSKITGVVNFSIGELIYVLHLIAVPVIIILLIYRVIITLKDYRRYGVSLLKFFGKIVSYVSIVYIVFMLIWGLNYSRQSIGETMELDNGFSSVEELYNLNEALIVKANQLRVKVIEDADGIMKVNGSDQSVLNRAPIGYKNVGIDVLDGSYARPKFISFEQASLYTQITGIYFPFTAEPNINPAIPDMLFPATTLHEMAHQRGFASEGEANYIAYLTSSCHPDVDFQYSGTVLALLYTMDALSESDLESATELKELYGNGLKRDFNYYNQFWDKYDGFIRDISSDVNDAYLKGNRQDDGVKSYGEMVDLLLAHYKKYGTV